MISAKNTRHALHQRERGMSLIEVLISVLLFAFGVLALVGLQATSISYSRDAKYRADAAFLSEQIIGAMWADSRSNLASYAHNVSGTNCSFSGGASSNTAVTSWIGASDTAGTVLGSLPGTASSNLQIIVDADSKVTVTICWKTPQDSSFHNHVAVAQILGGL